MRRGERHGREMGLILTRGKGVGVCRAFASWKVLVAPREDAHSLLSRALCASSSSSPTTPAYSRSIMIDKCPGSELKLLDLWVAIISKQTPHSSSSPLTIPSISQTAQLVCCHLWSFFFFRNLFFSDSAVNQMHNKMSQLRFCAIHKCLACIPINACGQAK